MVVAKLEADATGVMRRMSGIEKRLVDLSAPMKVAAADLAKVISDAQRADASPGGQPWPPLAASTIKGILGNSGAKTFSGPLQPGKSRAKLDKRPRRVSKKLYAGPLRPGQDRRAMGIRPLRGNTAQLFGTTFTEAAKDGVSFGSKARSKDGFPYWLSQQFGAKNAGRSRTVTIPARAWMPVEKVGGKTSMMRTGAASAFMVRFRALIAKYVTTGKK